MRALQLQKQTLAQHQLQSLKILGMSSEELELFLQNEHLENPMLDHSGGSSSGEGAAARTAQADPLLLVAQEQDDLRQTLRSQIRAQDLTKEEMRVTDYMIEALEDSGFFTLPPDAVARATGSSVAVVNRCLERLRGLEPVGVFSADLREHLLKQTEVFDIGDETLREIIRNHLEELAAGNLGNISRALDISTAQVRKYLLLLSSLSPRPAAGYGTGRDVAYIVPDLIVRFEGGTEITLNDGFVEDYRLNDYYLRLMRDTKDEELRRYFRERLQRVQRILAQVQRRRETLTAVAALLVERQEGFLRRGGSLKPLTMSEVAEQLQLHVSTVSRTVKGKYLQFPDRTIEMKSLFHKYVRGASEGEETGAADIKERLRRLIAKEDPKHPLSDSALCSALSSQGIRISRRAVAKYRAELRIRSSFERKSR